MEKLTFYECEEGKYTLSAELIVGVPDPLS